MHRSGFNDFDLDHELADLKESNNYINGRSPIFVVLLATITIIAVVSKQINKFFINFLFIYHNGLNLCYIEI